MNVRYYHARRPYIYKWLCHISVILPLIPCFYDFFSLSLHLVCTNKCLYITLYTNKVDTHDFLCPQYCTQVGVCLLFWNFVSTKLDRGIFFFSQSGPDQAALDSTTCTIFIFLSLLVVQILFSLPEGRSNLIFSLIWLLCSFICCVHETCTFNFRHFLGDLSNFLEISVSLYHPGGYF